MYIPSAFGSNKYTSICLKNYYLHESIEGESIKSIEHNPNWKVNKNIRKKKLL